MKTVYKYKLSLVAASEVILMPAHSLPLSVNFQGDELFMWVQVDTGRAGVKRKFEVFGTGRAMPDKVWHRYIGTAHKDNGLVLHLFEIL